MARKAKRHHKSLGGDNFYGNKLAELRADATNTFRQLASRSAGDSSALAELVEAAFSPSTDHARRGEAIRELTFALRTTWHETADAASASTTDDLFPLTILAEATGEVSLRLSRNAKKYLPQLRDIGHQSAHGRYYHARREDIERIQPGCRLVIEEFLHHANLL